MIFKDVKLLSKGDRCFITLEEYKTQTREIMEEMNNFQGDDEQLAKLLEELTKKYPELNEFNQKAMECEDLENFVELAKSYGMEFSSEESSKILFNSLKKAPGTLTKIANGELDDETLEMINGGKRPKWLNKLIGGIIIAGSIASGVAMAIATGGAAAVISVGVGSGTTIYLTKPESD